MLNRFLLIAAILLTFSSAAFAATDLNTADKAALDGIKSIGPKTADAIINERTKAGKFKDWDDFIRRVKGAGPKNAAKMSAGGLTINGAALANAPAAAPKLTEKPKEKK
ncbi:MAG: helix-hairpin-helix domain-containing protein [Pseudomonadota bacterium]|nr:helix-hairpin-helix domain-containing protein [Pseudomonadota bacterium]